MKAKALVATINVYSDGTVERIEEKDALRKIKLRHDWHTKYKVRYAAIKQRKADTIAAGLHPCEKCGAPVDYVGRGRPPKRCANHLEQKAAA